jgi:hypothetical protein
LEVYFFFGVFFAFGLAAAFFLGDLAFLGLAGAFFTAGFFAFGFFVFGLAAFFSPTAFFAAGFLAFFGLLDCYCIKSQIKFNSMNMYQFFIQFFLVEFRRGALKTGKRILAISTPLFVTKMFEPR